MDSSTADIAGVQAARAEEEGKQPSSTASQAPAPGGTITSSSAAAAAAGTQEYPAQPSIEEEVKQLVGSVSSWWSGFSKRSQEQINQARAQIDAQGGIMSIAKREAQRFEAQLTEAQKHAREDVVQGGTEKEKMDRTALGIDGLAAAGSYTPPVIDVKGKGKSKRVDEGDDGVAVDRLEERIEEQRRARESSDDKEHIVGAQGSSAGDSLFDADALGGIIDHKAVDEAVHAARQNAQNAVETVQTFWSKLQTDPRLSSMQASVAQTLQNIKVPGAQAETEGSAGQDGEGQTTEKRASAQLLPDLTKQFQGAFPQLDWKDSQVMAKRYFEASQSAAQSWGKEMSNLVGDLVKIVPPEEGADTASKPSTSPAHSKADLKVAPTPAQPAAKTVRAPYESKHTAIAAEADDDDFFDWDKEVEPQATKEASTVPSTAPVASPAEAKAPATEQAKPAAVPSTAATSQTASALPEPKTVLGDDDDDDSDWE